MNTKTLALFVIGGLLNLSCYAQGTFQNLDFESATVDSDPSPRRVSVMSGFPAWTIYFNTVGGITTNLFNFVPGSAASGISLLRDDAGLTGIPFAGRYTAALQGGYFSTAWSTSLGQTGLVPAGTMSLRFFGWSNRGTFIVSMNGQPLGVTALQDFGNYQEFGADISAFTGQTAELRFTQPYGADQYGTFYLDQISFSTAAIPEPSTWALLALGSALFGCAVRRRRK